MVADEENDSIWLFDVLDIIGANDEFRKTCKRVHMMEEVLLTFQNPASMYIFGSSCEGSYTPGFKHDKDAIRCDETVTVIEDISKVTGIYNFFLLAFTEEYTPVGYVKLQLVLDDTRITHETVKNYPILQSSGRKHNFVFDRNGRQVLCDLPIINNLDTLSRSKNKPNVTIKDGSIDMVNCYRCKTWPKIANEWLTRRRSYGWPTENSIQRMKSFGFFVIRKGHPNSKEKDLEWRISFSLQERQLMFSLTDVQHKCYIVLKILNRNIIKINYVTSYHWKTCLFHVMEENDKHIWKKRLLFYCVKLCLKYMLKWVKCGCCPNYFIPGDNLFDGKLNNSLRSKAANKLRNILDMGFNCFLHVKSNNICSYVESRKSLERSQQLRSNSKEQYKLCLKYINLDIVASLFQAFNFNILQHYYYQSNENAAIFIKFLWYTLDHIKRVRTITEHTEEETRSALSVLVPHILACLASNISAMAICDPNPQIRDFLLFGSFTLFKQAGLLGRLKFISVLYALQLHEDCEWFLDELDEEYIKILPAFCFCRFTTKDIHITTINMYNTSNSDVVTCICFLPSELIITPHALKYEMFRHFGVSLHEYVRANKINRWHYMAVVDCNTFFFFLKYLIKMKFGKVIEAYSAKTNLITLVTKSKNVKHVDVGYNLIAFCFCSPPVMLQYLKRSWLYFIQSWEQMTCSKFSSLLWASELKRTQYQFNAAKLHALVLLYNTWVAKKPPGINFCFNCFEMTIAKLQRCSMCHIATYCSPQCQFNNWNIHKGVCKIVRRIQ